MHTVSLLGIMYFWNNNIYNQYTLFSIFKELIAYLVSEDQFGSIWTLRYGRFGIVALPMTSAISELERPLEWRRVLSEEIVWLSLKIFLQYFQIIKWGKCKKSARTFFNPCNIIIYIHLFHITYKKSMFWKHFLHKRMVLESAQ